MYTFILLILITSLIGCSNNQEQKTCFECDSWGECVFKGVGCMTDEEWNKFKPFDYRPENQGNFLDKSKDCRKQKLPE